MTGTEEWGEWQKYGARGVSGGEALAAELARIVSESGIKSGIDTERGLAARLRYLDSDAGREALESAGVKKATLRRWKTGKASPSRRSRAKIEEAYTELRTHNMIKSGALTKRLQASGAGTRLEIYPVDQSRVPEKRWRPVQQRSVRVRDWASITSAWAAGDGDQLDAEWGDIVSDIASDYVAYLYVAGVGLGA